MTTHIELQREWTTEIAELIQLGDEYMNSLYPADCNELVGQKGLFANDFEFYLLFSQRDVVGSIGLRFQNEHPEIKRLFVKEEYRGRGYGIQLLEFALQHCRRRGYLKIQLETGTRQPDAIDIFEKHGFQKIGQFGSYQENPWSIFYERIL